MSYVSAKYMPPDPIALPDAPRQVQAVDTEGLVWSLTEDSQVGDWLDYIANDGVIEPMEVPPEPEPESEQPEPETLPAPEPEPEPKPVPKPQPTTVPRAEPDVVYGDPLPE